MPLLRGPEIYAMLLIAYSHGAGEAEDEISRQWRPLIY